MGFKLPAKAVEKYGKVAPKPKPKASPAPAPAPAPAPVEPEGSAVDPDPIDPTPPEETSNDDARLKAIADLNRARRAAQRAAQEAREKDRAESEERLAESSGRDALGLRDEAGKLPVMTLDDDGMSAREARRKIIEDTVRSRKLRVPVGAAGGLLTALGAPPVVEVGLGRGEPEVSRGGFTQSPGIPRAIIENPAKRVEAKKRVQQRRMEILEEQKRLNDEVFSGVSQSNKYLIEQLGELQQGKEALNNMLGRMKAGLPGGVDIDKGALGLPRVLASRAFQRVFPKAMPAVGPGQELPGFGGIGTEQRGDDPRRGEVSLFALRKFLKGTPGKPGLVQVPVSDEALEAVFYGPQKVREATLTALNEESLAKTNKPHPLKVLQDKIDAARKLAILRQETDAISTIQLELNKLDQALAEKAMRASEAAKGAAQEK